MSENEIYLDNSATTRLCDGAIKWLNKGIELYGNPSSLHKMGNDAKKLVERAEDEIHKALGLSKRPESSSLYYKLLFTSCGTESNNLALHGVIGAKNFKFLPRVITTDSEHPSITEPLSFLQKKGLAEVVYLSTKQGKIDKDELMSALSDNTVLLSLMHVNNETGAVYPIKELFSAAKEKKPDIITHSDMTQSFLKVGGDCPYTKQGADLITISAHKVHGPKGVACLAVKNELIKSKKIIPLMQGGGQQDGYRSGTENVMGIAAFAGACEEGQKELRNGFEEKMRILRETFISRLPASVRVNSSECFAPHIISITLPDIKSQTMLSCLSGEGIYVSSGSACSSHKDTKSRTLLAFGLTPKEADCTVRVSLCRYNTKEELIRAASAITLAVGSLIRMK